MSIFAVGDLHLSFTADKPMDIFGGEWIDHTEKLEKNWRSIVSEYDTVLIVGDTSWGMKLEEAKADLEWIENLPGNKILLKGNHDLWWSGINHLRKSFPELSFLQNNHIEVGDYAICGSRGWICPGDNDFTPADEKIYNRELLRMRMSLESAKNMGYTNIIAGLHFPPTNDRKEKSGFVELFEEFGVEHVVYGHLHGTNAYNLSLKGEHNGINYSLVSIDYLKCSPLLIKEV